MLDDAVDVAIFHLRSGLRLRCAVTEAIDGYLRNNEAKAHR
jgi:hypothetical protein